MKSEIEKEITCPACKKIILIKYNPRSRSLMRDVACDSCGALIQYITDLPKYEKAMKEINEYSKELKSLYKYSENSDNNIQEYIKQELEKERSPKDILTEAQNLQLLKDEQKKNHNAEKSNINNFKKTAPHFDSKKNVTANIIPWISKNWPWLLFVCGLFILSLIEQEYRTPWFIVLFLFPLGLTIWYYWTKSYEERFKKIAEEKKYIDNKVHHLRKEKQHSPDFSTLLLKCEKDYQILEVSKQNLGKQKGRDGFIFVCTILLMYIFIIPVAIGFLGWDNIIEMLSGG